MATQEQKKDYKVVKDFIGINTKANRTAIKEEEFSWLENAMPIGHANVRVVPAPSTVSGVTFASTVVYATYGNIGTTNYYIAFLSDGSATQVNISTSVVTTIGAAATFSTSGVQSSQWNNTLIIIIDPSKGYFQWDGTNLVKVGSLNFALSGTGTSYGSTTTVTVGAPNQTGGTQAVISLGITSGAITSISAYGTGLTPGTGYTSVPSVTLGGAGSGQTITASLISQPGTSIASFAGRVWIANGRTLYYTAAGTNNDFITTSSGNIVFNDSTLIGNITQLISANNFLYVFGTDSINVISDVRINSSTGATLLTNTNISASVGTDLSYAMMPYFRSIVFMNRYGVYALVGSTTSKLSDALDGVFPYIDFTKNVSAGQVLVYNILCAAFNFFVKSTFPYGSGGNRWVQAVYFDKKWFFTSQNSVTFITSIPVSGSSVLYTTTGTDLQQAYQDSASNISSYIQPALFGMGNIIRDKTALKFGVEAILSSTTVNTMSVTIDSENATSPSVTLSNYQNVTWVNDSFATVTWVNNFSQTVNWGNASTGYYLYRYDAEMWGKYISLTITSTSPNFTVSGIQFETEQRARF
jgi:hypothetical protein